MKPRTFLLIEILVVTLVMLLLLWGVAALASTNEVKGCETDSECEAMVR